MIIKLLMRTITLTLLYFLAATDLSCAGKTTVEPDRAKRVPSTAQLESLPTIKKQSAGLKPLPRQLLQSEREPLKKIDAQSKISASSTTRPKGKLKQDSKASPTRALLVPPPPPDTPVLLFGGNESQMPLYFWTLDDLKQRKKELKSEINALKTEIQEKGEQACEKDTRAKNFASLFEEGVVSKREVEAANTDKQEADKQLKSAKSKLSALEEMATRIDEKIKKQYKVSQNDAKKKGKIVKRSTTDRPVQPSMERADQSKDEVIRVTKDKSGKVGKKDEVQQH